MTNKQLATDILKEIGGKENINNVTHCATRLRISVNDLEQVNMKEIEKQQGILKVVNAGSQVQIVIGDQVNNVYQEFIKLTGETLQSKPVSNEKKENLFSRFFDLLSGSLTPLIPVFAGAGMIKAILILIVMFNLDFMETGTFNVLSAAGNAVFYFFPILLGFTIAKKLNVNVYIGATIGAALMEPNFTSLVTEEASKNFLGIPIIAMDYASSLLPILITILIYSYLEKFLKKYIPASLQIFMVPMLSLVIMVPFAVLVFGPFGLYVSNLLGTFFTWLISLNPVIAGILLSSTWIFIVSLGLHWALMPIAIQNLTTLGSDSILALTAGSSFAALGIVLGVYFKTRDKELKSFALTSGLSLFLAGVGEPMMYGIVFRYKKILKLGLVGSAVAGGLMGLFNVKLIAFTSFVNIFTIASFSPLVPTLIIWIVAAAINCALIMIFGFEDKPEKVEDSKSQINSPLNGELVELSQVNDDIFSSGVMGEGVAILPSEGKVVSPFAGEVVMITETSHAIGIKSDTGVELLIHIGIDSFKLEGRGFKVLVENGQKIKANDVLIEFDATVFEEANIDPTVIIVITNSNDFEQINIQQKTGQIETNQVLFEI